MSQRQYISTISSANDNTVAVRSNQVNVDLELGQARDVGRTTYIRSTYAARYNFAVTQYNSYETDSTKDKRYMRGGRFFLYNIIIIVLIIGSIICSVNASGNMPIIAVPIVISAIYLLITCYNWHIHRTNGSLIHDHMVRVQDRYMSSINEHLKISVHARIENRELIAATDGSTMAFLARLQEKNLNLDEIGIMLYGSTYIKKYASFPGESVWHFLIFTGLLITAIVQIVNYYKK
jgi:hypothetical protein